MNGPQAGGGDNHDHHDSKRGLVARRNTDDSQYQEYEIEGIYEGRNHESKRTRGALGDEDVVTMALQLQASRFVR